MRMDTLETTSVASSSSASLTIVSPTDAQNMLATAKRIFERHFDAVIREYEREGAAAKAELEDLKQFLSGISKERRVLNAAQDLPGRAV